MTPVPSARLPEGHLAAIAQLREKPHQGLPGKNPALYLGHGVSNCTVQLGLRFRCSETAPDPAVYLDDPLGSRRVQTDFAGVVEQNCTNLPFGDGESCAPTPTEHLFTGKERDQESGNDYFEARYYGSSMGRFLSPDPVFINADRVLDPQGLNLYAYVRNNPLTITDPTGLDFYQTCTSTKDNGATCQQVQNGSSKVWVQGTTNDKGAFTANRIANDENGNLVDTAHGNAAVSGSFDQNGVHLNGAQGQFIQGSNETTLGGSGVFSGITGNFFDACGGSCQAHGTLTDSDPGSGALGHVESLLHQQSKFASSIDALSGAHPWGTTQWKDANGYVHMIQIPGAAMDMHFEGHPTGAGLTQFILHSVDTVKDLFSGRAGAEGPITQREGSLPQ